MTDLNAELKKLRRLTDALLHSVNSATGINTHDIRELDTLVSAVEDAAAAPKTSKAAAKPETEPAKGDKAETAAAETAAPKTPKAE